jgi:ATP-dependent RNA helicase DeaD
MSEPIPAESTPEAPKGPPPLPEATLDSVPESIRQAVQRAGWDDLLPVQAKSIPYMLAKRDLMVQSRTGSGKTGAFLLPLLDLIDPRRKACQALILVPTRELAKQVAAEAEMLARGTAVRTIAVYGGVSYRPQIDAFQAGAEIVVGTPGRVLDHLLKRTLTLDHLKTLTFDEADRMLSMGFYPDMREVQSYLPNRPINAYMFSATYPPQVMRLAGQFLHEPMILSLSADHVHVTEVEHAFLAVTGMDKDRALARLIEVENPGSALIFCNTRVRVDYVSTVLGRFGYNVGRISSDLTQAAREQIMARIRKGEIRFLVATDVASRGIDLPELSHVILYDLPDDPEDYIHRAGRTGRAGSSGIAISMVTQVEKMGLDRISKRYGIDMQERETPSDEDVQAIVGERLMVQLEAKARTRDKLKIERMSRFLPLAAELASNDEGLSLLAMLLDDAYQPPVAGLPESAQARAEPRSRSSDRPRSSSGRQGSRRPRSRSRGGGSRRR